MLQRVVKNLFFLSYFLFIILCIEKLHVFHKAIHGLQKELFLVISTCLPPDVFQLWKLLRSIQKYGRNINGPKTTSTGRCITISLEAKKESNEVYITNFLLNFYMNQKHLLCFYTSNIIKSNDAGSNSIYMQIFPLGWYYTGNICSPNNLCLVW